MLDAQLVLRLELLTHKKKRVLLHARCSTRSSAGAPNSQKKTFYYMLDAQLVLWLELLTHKKKKHFIICSMLNSFFGWGS